MKKTILIHLLILSCLGTSIADESKIEDDNVKLNVFTGVFDYSHDKQRAGIVGFQHQNTNLNRNSFLGNLSPITGGMISENNSTYLYTGVQAQYKIGNINFTPSFSPGYYNEGDGKDLGNSLEFKSELQFSLDLPRDTQFGFSYNHLSNGGLGDKNPGANSYMFNFFKSF